MNQTRDLSLGETEKMAMLAGRGVGLSWGLAEEAGKAVRWLEQHGLPGAEEYLNYLEERDTDLDQSGTSRSCLIALAATFCDRIDALSTQEHYAFGELSHPMLLLPFVALAARTQTRRLCMQAGASRAVCDGFDVWVSRTCFSQERNTSVKVTFDTSTNNLVPLKARGRGCIAQNGWSALQSFAARTYAPATERSRILGAGAGTEDND